MIQKRLERKAREFSQATGLSPARLAEEFLGEVCEIYPMPTLQHADGDTLDSFFADWARHRTRSTREQRHQAMIDSSWVPRCPFVIAGIREQIVEVLPDETPANVVSLHERTR